jgi:hypothetical protein
MLAAYSPSALIRSAVRRRLLLSHIHCVVLAFPAIFFEPKEGESTAAFLLLVQSNIHETRRQPRFLEISYHSSAASRRWSSATEMESSPVFAGARPPARFALDDAISRPQWLGVRCSS